MKIRSLGYNIKQGFRNIVRNKMFSLASVATITACIFLFGVFYSIVINIQYMVDKSQETLCVTVFFDDDLTAADKTELSYLIGARTEVSRIEYISAEEAWETYKHEYFGDNIGLAEGFKDDNPLANSDSYKIYLNDAKSQTTLVKYLENLDGIRKVNKSDIMANSISNVAVLVGYASAIIIILLLAVAIFLIANTIVIGISVRKDEISIMKLIGATDAFVNAPFIVEGLVIGLVGSLVPLLVLFFLYDKVVGFILSNFNGLGNILTFMSVGQVYVTLLPIAIALGLGIGLVGSAIALRKHTNV
ncbi:MAG: permease-like cell division protein FtsX [Lachnospiraceae bacterium]